MATIAEKLKLIADNQEKVYVAGKADEREEFWEDFLPKEGKSGNWRYLFYSPRWNDVNFYPTKDIEPVGPASYSFFSHGITNFKQRLIDCGVKLDTSRVTGGNYMFASCSVLTHLPTISFTGLTESISNVFNSDKTLVEIEKIILKEDGSTTFLGWFENCHALETITFEGVIGQDINFQWSPLSVESMKSIISCLKYLTGHEVFNRTITFNDACWAALEESGDAPPNGSISWKEYVFWLGWNY